MAKRTTEDNYKAILFWYCLDVIYFIFGVLFGYVLFG